MHLDAVRGVAALVVCIGHTRGFLFIDHPTLEDLKLQEQILYFITGFAEEAVIVFFVLSGFLVGGNVVRTVGDNIWSWRFYLLRRLTRLWIVIVPTLFLTLFWDSLGEVLAPSAYDGAFRELVHVETPTSAGYAGLYRELFAGGTYAFPAQDHGITTLIGNLMFLQFIVVPSFGTNIPMWSLANEFWYYLMFPFIWLAVNQSTSIWFRALYALAFVFISILLPLGISTSFALFGFGILSYIVVANGLGMHLLKRPVFIAVVGILFSAMLLASYGGHWFGHKMIVGTGFALLLAGLAVTRPDNRMYNRVASGLAQISYTLYLTHFPLFAFIFFTALESSEFGPCLRFFILVPTVIAFAIGVWWCFERQTNRVFNWLKNRPQGV